MNKLRQLADKERSLRTRLAIMTLLGCSRTCLTRGQPQQLTVVGVAVAHPESELPFLVALPDLVTDVAQQGARGWAFWSAGPIR